MSRGPGRVERLLEQTFTQNPTEAFWIDQLCALAYPGVNRVEKKHRVAVLRAARNIIDRIGWGYSTESRRGGVSVFYNLLDERSYVLGRAACFHFWWSREDLYRAVDEPTGRYYGDRQPGGAWATHVQINRLHRAGDSAGAEALQEQLRRTVTTALRSRW